MTAVDLVLVHASKAYPGAQWDPDQFSVLKDAKPIGGISRETMAGSTERWWWEITTAAAQRAQPALAIKGPAASRDAAMIAFRSAWDALAAWEKSQAGQ